MGWFDKLISKATFWTDDDNQRVARNEEEERKRKQQEAARATVVRPNQPAPMQTPGLTSTNTTPKPLFKVGSQSDTLFANPLQKPGTPPTTPFNGTQPLAKAPAPVQPPQNPQPKPVTQPVVPKPTPKPPMDPVAIRQKAIDYKTPKVQDVNGYYASDAKLLEEELAKGDAGDVHRIQGLMTSLDNRKKELQEFHKTRGENTSFKSARALQETIKNTRGDWTDQNKKLKEFWDAVGANESTDFQQFQAEKRGEIDPTNPMMLRVAGMWKNGNGQNYSPNFEDDDKKVQTVQMRQKIADISKEYGGVAMDQLGNKTIFGELDRFENSSPEEQKKTLTDLQEIIDDNENNYTGNQDLKRKAEQAYMLQQTLLDSGKQRSDWHTKLSDAGDFASHLGGALLESPKHVWQAGDVVLNQEILGKEDKGAMLDKQHAAGELSDEEYNREMNKYARSLEWVPDEKDGMGARILTAAGTSADTVATFLPVLSAAKGIKGAYVAEKLAGQIAIEQGLSRTAARVAAKETLQAMAKDATAGSVKRLMAEEALVNAGFSGVGSLREGEFDPKKTVTETLVGAGLGAGAVGVGNLTGKALSKFRGASTELPETVEDIGRVTTRLEEGGVDHLLRSSYANPEQLSRVAELEKIVDDTSIPAYQKLDAKNELAALESEIDDNMAKALGVGEDPLDRPAFQHKEDMQKIVDEEEAALNQKVNDNPEIDDAAIAEYKRQAYENVLRRADELDAARYGAAAAPVNVPSPDNPIALAKAPTDQVTQTADDAILPQSFNPAPLQKVDAATLETPAQKAELAPATDAAGNEALTTDVTRARQMAEAGMAPGQGASPVAAAENAIETEAERTAARQVSDEAAAPRVRERGTELISDEQLRADMAENFAKKETLNLADTENAAQARLNGMEDADLVTAYSQPVNITTPENYLMAVGSIRRLERIAETVPEAKEAIHNALDGLASYSSKAGQGLRVTQMLFDDMPTSMKADWLIRKVGKAGVDMTDGDRGVLISMIEKSDGATQNLRNLEAEAQGLIDNGALVNLTPETKARIGQLRKEIQAATQQKELAAGEAWRFYQDQLPKGALGKRAADVARTAMLGSVSGRAFDLISTTATATDDILTQGVSNLIGKGINLKKAGTVADTIISPRKLAQGFKEGFGRMRKAFAGKDYVEDFMGEARRSTRGDINTGGTGLRKVVRAFTEAPTNLTRGLREQELYRQGMQEAAQQGLKGESRRAYAELRSLVPSKQQLEQAVETHMRANMLHNNGTSRFLNGIATSLDSRGHGALAVLVRNQIMPFTSWLGGNINRTLTDKNVLHNIFKIADSAVKRDPQMFADNIARLAVNSGEAYAAGMMLTRAGIISDTDANGDSYGGLYFHIGDRYIPVAIAGTVSVPLILGNSIQKMMDGVQDGKTPFDAFSNAATNMIVNGLGNAGVASVFGGDNTFQSLVGDLGAESKVDPEDRNLNPFAPYAGDIVRQYIPGVGGDINSFMDYTGANPTHEAPLTKVKKENEFTGKEKTDVAASEKNKTLAKIPILSQGLPRDEGKPAKDPIDRVTRGNHETVKMQEERKTTETKAQEKKRRKEDDIPDTDDGIQARIEDGAYGKAIAGLEQKLSDQKDNKDIPKSKREETEQDIKRLKVTMDGNYSPDIIKLYSDTSLSEWRNMIDPDSDEYDPETAGLLQKYDQDLTAAGVSKGKKLDAAKFSQKKSGSGGRGGGSGKTMSTDIAVNKQSFDGFTPLKAQSATQGAPVSAIPQLQKVANYSRKPKKISSSRGTRV